MINSGKNYIKLVTQITGEDWEGDSFDRLLIHNNTEELDRYIEHLYCCDYKRVKVLGTKEQEVATIDTPYDEEVKKTLKLMYEYFLDRVYDVDGEYLCERLGITPETLEEQLNYLFEEV